MYKVKVYVTLRESVLDPQGNAVKGALHSLAFNAVQDVRIGKYLELKIDQDVADIDKFVKEMCEQLLTNVVIEDYRYDVEEVVAQ